MKCRDLLAGLSEYIDQEMKQEICRELEAHMHHCPDCRLYVDQMKGTVALVRNLGNGHVEEKVVVRLRAKLFSERGPTGMSS